MRNGLWIALGLVWLAGGCAPQAREAVSSPQAGVFQETFWSKAKRLRVNSPDTATGPYKERWEAKEKGVLTIDVPGEALARAGSAKLYMELWGGHPGVADKQVSVNQNPWIAFPEVGSEESNCTYTYPRLSVPLTDLHGGSNALEFTCEKGTTFWGHYLIDNTAVVLSTEKSPTLPGFWARVVVRPQGDEKLALELEASGMEEIESVDYQGFYRGYNENGETEERCWHGFTRGGKMEGHLASATGAPFRVVWDLSMIPDQEKMAVRAILHFKGRPELTYMTAGAGGLATPARSAHVKLIPPAVLPRPFWSRDGQAKRCELDLDVDPAQVERAALCINLWDGGRGTRSDPVTLNGHPVAAAGEGKHDLIYRVIPIDAAMLSRGSNTLRVLSDTKEHGIEVLLPGPTLIVRTRATP